MYRRGGGAEKAPRYAAERRRGCKRCIYQDTSDSVAKSEASRLCRTAPAPALGHGARAAWSRNGVFEIFSRS